MTHSAQLLTIGLAAILSSDCRARPGNASPVRPDQPAASDAMDRISDAGAAISLDSPYRRKANVFKGQLHAHTINSDGTQSPAAVMVAYRKAGYDFASITDHNRNTPDPRVPGILFLPGVENDHACLHENRIDATTAAPGARMPQDVIDQARREGSFVQVNHPDWPGIYPLNPCWSNQALLAVRGYDAIEAWNASDDEANRNAETRIDYVLSHGRRTNLTAVDDCHDVRAGYCMTSSVRVFADALTAADIMASLKAGNFYASSGAAISSVTAVGPTLSVSLPEAGEIEFVSDGGAVVKRARGVQTSSFTVTGRETYVRIRVTDAKRRRAWSNPVYVTPSSRPPAGGG
ncbi:MAG: hypothetical protein RL272_1131 [Candidatus Parcubacteria bacterium]